jgi:hypothetical protein
MEKPCQFLCFFPSVRRGLKEYIDPIRHSPKQENAAASHPDLIDLRSRLLRKKIY